MIATVLLGCSCVCLGAILVYTITKKSKYLVKKSSPGPRGLPFIGHGLNLSVDNAHLIFSEWAKQYGDIVTFTMFGRKIVVLNDPDVIRKAFAAAEYSGILSDRPPSFIGEFIADKYKDVLFREYDDICRKLKRLTMKAMCEVLERRDTYKTRMHDEIRDYVSLIASSGGNDTDVIRPLETTLCRIISLMFTGVRPSESDDILKAVIEFDIHGNAMIMPSTHLLLKNLPFLRLLPGYYGTLYRNMLNDKDRLMECLVKNLKASYDRENPDAGLLHVLFDCQETEAWLTDEFILGIVMDLINTSTLTSRGVLSGIYFLLVHFQQMQQKIYEEICQVIGKERHPRTADLKEMPYTHAFILETLRYQSHLGITATHTSLSQDVMFEGYFIPKGSSVYGNLWHVHHDDKFWCDPLEFRPDRFLQENGHLLPADHDNRRRNYMPFGVGNRSCMGISMTYDRMFLFVTTLLQSHALLPPSNHELPGHHPAKMTPGTVLQAPDFFCKVIAR